MMRVPEPGELSIRRVPPCASARSASPRNPEPSRDAAPPIPSSSTSTSTSSVPSSLVARMEAFVAREC
jgi:hypothetical protein